MRSTSLVFDSFAFDRLLTFTGFHAIITNIFVRYYFTKIKNFIAGGNHASE